MFDKRMLSASYDERDRLLKLLGLLLDLTDTASEHQRL